MNYCYWSVRNFCGTTLLKCWVLWYSLKACKSLIWHGIVHDFSKYSKSEAPYFAKSLHKLRKVKYGTIEYYCVHESNN